MANQHRTIPPLTVKDIARFRAKIEHRGAGDCWEWQACRNPQGYGLFDIRHKSFLAHRVAWVIAHDVIPDGIFILHRCDNPPCVNPAHLWLGTHADNKRDSVDKGRHGWACGAANGRAKLRETDVRLIRRLYRRGHWSQFPLARVYGVSHCTISEIVNGKTWRSIL